MLDSAIVPLAGSGPQVDIDVLLAVAAAIRDCQQLRTDYRSHDDTQTCRVLEPIAWCTPDAAGIWWRGTSTDQTGEPSDSTG